MAEEMVETRDLNIEIGENEENLVVPDEIRELQTELINLNTKLVFAVATCECENSKNCEVYNNAKEIAKVLKKMQDVITVTTREVRKKRRK